MYIWSFIPVLACTKHSKILIDTHPITGKRLSWFRSHLSRFDGDSYNFSNPVHSVDPAVFQMSQYFESLILRAQVRVNSPIILRDLTFRESLSLIHFIAHYQTRLLGESFKPVFMSNLELVKCYFKDGVKIKGAMERL